MTSASRRRAAAAVVAGATLLTACTGGVTEGSSSTTIAPTGSIPTSAPAPSQTIAPTPTPSPDPPPLTPGYSRGALIIVQQAEDAALVSGEQPIRLTLARTGNTAAWVTAPPQKSSGVMSTEAAMLTLGWRPADDGTTSVLPNPRPNGLLAHAAGSLAFTVQRANVRADGTLVLDIRPIGPIPETVESYGPVSLTLDGAPGVLDLDARLGSLTLVAIVTGDRNQQAVIQVRDQDGEIVESGFVAPGRTLIDSWLDVTSGTTVWSDPIVEFTPPGRGTQGSLRVRGQLTVDGVTTQIDQVVARWSLPLG